MLAGSSPWMPQAGLVAAPTDGHLQDAGEQHILTPCQGAAALLGRTRDEPKEMWDELLSEGSGVVGIQGWDVSRGRIPDGQFLKLEGCSEGSWLFKAGAAGSCSKHGLLQHSPHRNLFSPSHPAPLPPQNWLNRAEGRGETGRFTAGSHPAKGLKLPLSASLTVQVTSSSEPLQRSAATPNPAPELRLPPSFLLSVSVHPGG